MRNIINRKFLYSRIFFVDNAFLLEYTVLTQRVVAMSKANKLFWGEQIKCLVTTMQGKHTRFIGNTFLLAEYTVFT